MKTGGKQAYFATARITNIIGDSSKADHFYALIDDFLPFDHAIPFKDGDHYYEDGLRKEDGSTSKGAFGRAVRNISDEEYDLILAAGFAHVLGKRDRKRPAPDPAEEARLGFGDNPQMPYEVDSIGQRTISQMVQRPFRDRAFSVAIKAAYRTPALSRASADKWRPAIGGSGRTHPPGGRPRAGQGTQRPRTLGNCALDV